MTRSLVLAPFLLTVTSAFAQRVTDVAPSQRQTQEDDYTRYELLAPDTAQFRIYYDDDAAVADAH